MYHHARQISLHHGQTNALVYEKAYASFRCDGQTWLGLGFEAIVVRKIDAINERLPFRDISTVEGDDGLKYLQ